MRIKGALIIVLILLLIVVAAWIGITVYDSVNDVTVNPLADEVKSPIPGTIDNETINMVNERVNELEITPEEFHKIEDREFGTSVSGNTSSSSDSSDNSETDDRSEPIDNTQ